MHLCYAWKHTPRNNIVHTLVYVLHITLDLGPLNIVDLNIPLSRSIHMLIKWEFLSRMTCYIWNLHHSIAKNYLFGAITALVREITANNMVQETICECCENWSAIQTNPKIRKKKNIKMSSYKKDEKFVLIIQLIEVNNCVINYMVHKLRFLVIKLAHTLYTQIFSNL